MVFVTITTIITVYALIGDDIRLLTTDEPADHVFNFVTISCIVIFTVEVVLCTAGKNDYFLSFFFLLDVISTVTLFLDLSWVGELLMEDEEDLDNVRGSKTARLGARMARIVRVIRLVRILKLYKTVSTVKRGRSQERISDPGDEDDYWSDAEDTEERADQHHRESNVSKKLSELTTRRVICLVLVMLLVLPVLRIEVAEQFPTSANYGADLVHEAFTDMADNGDSPSYRTTYEKALLQYIYYHNWFAARADECPYQRLCPREHDSHLFWVGIASTDQDIASAKAQLAQVRNGTVRTWEQEVAEVLASETSSWMYNFGEVPEEALSIMGQSWDASCDSTTGKYRRFGFSLLGEVIEHKVRYAVKCPENLRRVERNLYHPRLNINGEAFKDWHFVFVFDGRPFVEKESMLSLIITFFVCLALTTASLVFSCDVNRLVLYPVENMIAKVETIRTNPLVATKVADEEFKAEERHRVKQRRQSQHRFQALCDLLMCHHKPTANELMETVILEKTIIKLGSLLALGFGEAGANIIEHNMHGVDSACVDAMVEGTRVECIIGATRIRDFSIATEVLQAHVMTFVNRIAEIVHGVIDEFHGAANKNNGDTFLIIWRSNKEEDKVCKLADMSLVAFARILGAVHRSPMLASYRGHPGLQQRLGKNCRVNLSSGLHYGWAIEGAVGSEFKIDASYLSPNVSVAESVEHATQVYGVNILVAESMVSICSPALAAKCRLIDRVILPGSTSPMELHVVDADTASLTVEALPKLQINWTTRQRYKVRQFLETEKSMKWKNEVQIVTLFNESPDIAAMRFRYTLEFIHVFNMGYQNYSQGEWQVAQRLLMRTHTMLGMEDGPSGALLRFMEAEEFQAPEGWQGIRILDPVHFLG